MLSAMRISLCAAIMSSAAAAPRSAKSSSPLRVLPCDSWSGGSASGGWSVSHGSDGACVVRHGDLCLDVEAGQPVAAPCQSKASQRWRTNDAKTHLFIGADSDLDPAAQCLAVSGTSYSVGPGVLLGQCNPHSPPGVHPPHPKAGSIWSFNSSTGSIQSGVGGCCGDIFQTRPVCLAVDTEPTCAALLAKDKAASKWCDPTLDATVRAKALIAQMTLDEKASNMDSHNFGVPRLGVPPNIFSEALHGMCSGCGKKMPFDGYTSTGCPTSFPQVISMGASWNRSLWTAVGTAVSDELRGLYSQGSAPGWESALFLWAPNVNPFRDPRWGRGQEVVSEEPLVCSEYAAHYIPALQGIVDSDTDKPFLKSVATAKHFFDYDLEGVPPETRQQIYVNVSARDQVEYFSPPFESAVKRGKTQSVMCSCKVVMLFRFACSPSR